MNYLNRYREQTYAAGVEREATALKYVENVYD